MVREGKQKVGGGYACLRGGRARQKKTLAAVRVFAWRWSRSASNFIDDVRILLRLRLGACVVYAARGLSRNQLVLMAYRGLNRLRLYHNMEDISTEERSAACPGPAIPRR